MPDDTRGRPPAGATRYGAIGLMATAGPGLVDLGRGTISYRAPGRSWAQTATVVEEIGGSRFDDTTIGDARPEG